MSAVEETAVVDGIGVGDAVIDVVGVTGAIVTVGNG